MLVLRAYRGLYRPYMVHADYSYMPRWIVMQENILLSDVSNRYDGEGIVIP